MRVVVAGATGRLGRALVHAFLERGADVVALARSPGKLGAVGRRVTAVRKGDVTRPRTLRGACDGADAVVSAIGLVGASALTAPVTHDAVDHRGNLHLLREAERAGVRAFLYASVCHADAASDVPLLRAKGRFEDALRASPLAHVIARPTAYHHTIAEAFMPQARRGVVVLAGPGTARVAPVHVEDVARWMADRVADEQEVQDVGGPDVLTWDAVAETCLRAAGKPPRVVHAPAGALDAAARVSRVVRPKGAAAGELAFLRHVLTTDYTAPAIGDRGFAAFVDELAA